MTYSSYGNGQQSWGNHKVVPMKRNPVERQDGSKNDQKVEGNDYLRNRSRGNYSWWYLSSHDERQDDQRMDQGSNRASWLIHLHRIGEGLLVLSGQISAPCVKGWQGGVDEGRRRVRKRWSRREERGKEKTREGMVKRDIRFQGEGRSRRPFKLKGMTRDRETERGRRREQKRGRTSREWMTGGNSSRKDDKLWGWMNESFKQNVPKERNRRTSQKRKRGRTSQKRKSLEEEEEERKTPEEKNFRRKREELEGWAKEEKDIRFSRVFFLLERSRHFTSKGSTNRRWNLLSNSPRSRNSSEIIAKGLAINF